MEKLTKIFFTDIDETLVTTDKRLTDGNRKAIEDFLAWGNVLAISTGRALAGAIRLMKSLGLYGSPNTYISAFNGGQIYDTCHEKTLYKRALNQDQIRFINQCAREYGIHLQGYTDTSVLAEHDNDNLQKYCRIQNLPSKIVPDLGEALESSCKLLGVDFFHPENVTGFRSYLKERVHGDMDIFLSNDWLLEIVASGVNKGAALRFLADYLRIPVEHTISAGDQENDLPMIRAAGVGCAMKNAVPMLKDVSDYITENDNNHDGIAEILGRFA